MIQDTFQSLLTTILIFASFFILKNYLPSYLSEKGKNLAQKEDIEEITDKIEGIKHLYAKEHGEIQQKLTHLLYIQGNYRDDERKAIIEFYEAYYHWMYTVFEIPITTYNFSRIDLLEEKMQELNGYFININKASAKLVLLVKSDDLIAGSSELIVHLVKYKGWAEGHLLKLSFLLNDLKRLNAAFTEMNPFLPNYDEVKARDIASQDTSKRAEVNLLVKNYQDSKISEFQKCNLVSKKFAFLAKNYLTSIS